MVPIMEIVLALFVLAVVGSLWGGSLLIARGLRTSKAPPVPPARLANLEGGEAAYAKLSAVAARAPRKLGKGLVVSLGLAIIAAPWAFVYWLFAGLGDMKFDSKGRVLRIKSRARLPEVATGEGWSADAVVLRGTLTAAERGVLGELWLLAARMEHASVAAFSQLSLHLSALGAPARLLAATHRAALEEIHHAERCFAIVRAITGVEHTAGPIAALGDARTASIDLPRLAIGSLVDGCVAEGIASDVATRSAAAADEPAIVATLTLIAREEAGHAELAWDVLAWCLDRGDAGLRRAVAARIESLGSEVTTRLPAIAGVDQRVLARHGVIDQDALGAIAVARVAAVQDRARDLLQRFAPARYRAA